MRNSQRVAWLVVVAAWLTGCTDNLVPHTSPETHRRERPLQRRNVHLLSGRPVNLPCSPYARSQGQHPVMTRRLAGPVSTSRGRPRSAPPSDRRAPSAWRAKLNLGWQRQRRSRSRSARRCSVDLPERPLRRNVRYLRLEMLYGSALPSSTTPSRAHTPSVRAVGRGIGQCRHRAAAISPSLFANWIVFAHRAVMPRGTWSHDIDDSVVNRT